MCYGCYEEAGKPAIVNDRTMAAARAVRDLYELTPVGGRMHIVTDDWNLEDDNLAFCRRQLEGIDDAWAGMASKEQTQAEWICLKAFECLGEEERASALAIYDEFIDGVSLESAS